MNERCYRPPAPHQLIIIHTSVNTNEGRLCSSRLFGRENKGQHGELNVPHLILAPYKGGLFDQAGRSSGTAVATCRQEANLFFSTPGTQASCQAGLAPAFVLRKLISEWISGVLFKPCGETRELGTFWKQPAYKNGKTPIGFNTVITIDKTHLLYFSCLLKPVGLFISLISWDFDMT